MNDSQDDVVAASLPPGASPPFTAALKHVLENFAQHSKKNAELIDVLIQALKTVNQELQHQKVKNHLVEARLRKAELRSDELAKVMDAFRRQGWVQ